MSEITINCSEPIKIKNDNSCNLSYQYPSKNESKYIFELILKHKNTTKLFRQICNHNFCDILTGSNHIKPEQYDHFEINVTQIPQSTYNPYTLSDNLIISDKVSTYDNESVIVTFYHLNNYITCNCSLKLSGYLYGISPSN